MPDLQHTMGGDLTVSPSGDLALSAGSAMGQERVLKRLLTNPGDYIWHLAYGAGLPAAVGQPTRPERLRGLIRAQMLREAAVARTPTPSVEITAGVDGTVGAMIRYADNDDGTTQTISIPGE